MFRLLNWCVVAAIACAGCGGGGPQPTTEQPKTGPFGTWKVVAVEGRAPGVTQGSAITLFKDVGEDIGADKIVVRRFKPSDPAQIDLQFPGEGDAWKGVCELQGDDLRIALNRGGQPAPEAPRGKPADCVLTLKRQ